MFPRLRKTNETDEHYKEYFQQFWRDGVALSRPSTPREHARAEAHAAWLQREVRAGRAEHHQETEPNFGVGEADKLGRRKISW